jgi:hypothetical protein
MSVGERAGRLVDVMVEQWVETSAASKVEMMAATSGNL